MNEIVINVEKEMNEIKTLKKITKTLIEINDLIKQNEEIKNLNDTEMLNKFLESLNDALSYYCDKLVSKQIELGLI